MRPVPREACASSALGLGLNSPGLSPDHLKRKASGRFVTSRALGSQFLLRLVPPQHARWVSTL